MDRREGRSSLAADRDRRWSLVGYAAAQDYFEAAAFVVRAAGMKGAARAVADSKPSRHRVGRSPSRGAAASCGRDATRRPTSAARPILLVPGVHAAGIAEPRLIKFAKEIAATGHPVVTAELPDLGATGSHRARPT